MPVRGHMRNRNSPLKLLIGHVTRILFSLRVFQNSEHTTHNARDWRRQILQSTGISRAPALGQLGGVPFAHFLANGGVFPSRERLFLMAAPYRACAGSARRLRRLRWLRDIFLDGAPTPPNLGGKFARSKTVSYCLSVFVSLCFLQTSNAAAQNPARELVTTYCVTCHNERLRTGGLALDTTDPEHVSNSAETWEKVVVKLRSRSMPPAGARRPDNATYDTVSTWLEGELDRAAAANLNPGRPANLHRLNRTEYANAVRDLTGIEIDAASMLPPDQQAHGFDTNADALLMAPALLDRYLNAAAKIARLAIGDPTIPPAFDRYTAVKGNSNEQTWLWQTERLSEDFPLGSRGGIATRHYFPVDGEYVIKLRLQRTFQDVIRGLNEPSQIEIQVDGVRVGRFGLGGGADLAAQAAADYRDVRPGALTNSDDALQVRIPLKAGLRTVVATILKSNDVRPEGLGPARIPIWSREGDVPTVPVYISSMLIGGPYNGQTPKDSPSRNRIFVCRPTGTVDEAACATKILSSLARRAYRRKETEDDV